ncbi:BrnA antitoxin family protein [Actibacterium pelagium]|uniref:BrnA antitoxin of type II toxin-antitoxin system n=1 Tax=Actibacterium pelagium TaxID=2029103 RepID=A0A917EIC8_9RHOB|nr:BrnA antitoxin family protein [Actibacterium pelagium]GGE48020.1 hypothetical protein GCM10011517_14770 [Actibacterium pelagium]
MPRTQVTPNKMTKAERLHWSSGTDALAMIEHDLHSRLMTFGQIPTEWHSIWQDEDRLDDRRTRVTARFDADVVKFFKALGPGYQHRMNRVLRAYTHMRLAKLVEGPDTTDYILGLDQAKREGLRPKRRHWACYLPFHRGDNAGASPGRPKGRRPLPTLGVGAASSLIGRN